MIWHMIDDCMVWRWVGRLFDPEDLPGHTESIGIDRCEFLCSTLLLTRSMSEAYRRRQYQDETTGEDPAA